MNQKGFLPRRLLPWAALLALAFQACAMTVGVRVQRLPAMNTAGIRRVSIIPFDPGNNQELNRQAARFITAEAAAKIMDTTYFTVIDPAEIERLEKQGESVENYLDAFFVGQVLSVTVKNSSRKEERVNYETGEPYFVTIHEREVDLMFNYNFRRARDGSLIGVVTKQGKQRAQNENREELPTPQAMLQAIVAAELVGLEREVAPHTVEETRILMKETTKDKILKKRMSETYALTRAGNYKQALNEYLALYAQYGTLASGYNGAILYEVTGDLDRAAAFMAELFEETGSPKVADELGRLRKSLADRETLASAYGDTRTRVDTLIAEMVSVVASKLPPEAKVAVMHNGNTQTGLAIAIADGITHGLQEQGVTIVDRNNTALLEAEKRYQMSGDVSDDDFVGIGNEAGANTFVLVAVTGASTLRRLQVRVLDLGRNVVLYQSPQSDRMNL